MGRGRLLKQGSLAELTRAERPVYSVRVKNDAGEFGTRLAGLGCLVDSRDGSLLIELPAGGAPDLIWRTALDAGEQIRTLEPLRNTLEEVFLEAVAELS
jgi:hypothetical protein